MLLKIFHVVTFFNLHVILWLNNIPLYRYTTVGSLSDDYLGSFNLWTIVNNVSMNIHIQVFSEHISSVLFGYIFRSEIAGLYGDSVFDFLRPTKWFSTAATSFFILTSKVLELLFFHNYCFDISGFFLQFHMNFRIGISVFAKKKKKKATGILKDIILVF